MSESKKIFLVDDVEYNLVRTKQVLKDYYTVYTLNSADSMFALLEKVIPDLIILDINMPDIDGYQALEKLKADSRFAEIPVIFLSGKEDEDSILKGFLLDAVDHIVKPFSPEDLRARIENCLKSINDSDDIQGDDDKAGFYPSILAVDDSPSMLRSIHFALHSRFKVHTLQKPENLQKLLSELKVDLFLLDYNMPISGTELVKIIRENPDFKETPIVFLTSESSSELLKEAIKLGIKDFIVKPFNPRKLRARINACLAKNGVSN